MRYAILLALLLSACARIDTEGHYATSTGPREATCLTKISPTLSAEVPCKGK
jgi:hypothetical protein